MTMKKTLQFALILLIAFSGLAQSGIGTIIPEQSALLELSAPDKALLLSEIDQISDIANPENGMMVYDKSENCIKIFQDNQWSECLYQRNGTISTLLCQGKPDHGLLLSGVPAQEAYTVIEYTGGNGSYHAGQTIASTGVTGLTATLNAGSFVTGNGNLLYTITGTPASAGTAQFNIAIGGQNCTLTRTVLLPASVATMDCATGNSFTLDQDVATATSATVAYTGGNGGVYLAQDIPSTGVIGLTARIEQGLLASGAGSLTYSITGMPIKAGTASFAVTIGGQSCTISIVVNGAVAGLNCAQVTNSGTLLKGKPASGAVIIVPYTGGTGGSYTAQSISSTGITGLTATLASGTFTTGDGTLNYTISGTPSGYGTASFDITISGYNCTVTRTVYDTVTAIDCATATNTGTLTQGVAANNTTTIIGYTGATGGSYPGQTIQSTGISGLTATLLAGTFANGSGSLTYTISGTPSASGTASFAINVAGENCTITRAVFGNISSLDCEGALITGSLTQGVASTGVTSVINYTGGSGGNYPAQSIASTGVTGLTATLVAGAFANGSGSLTYTISGTPATAGTAAFGITIAGQSCTLLRTVYGSVATVNCAGATNTGSLYEGVTASGVSSIIGYTGGIAGSQPIQGIPSTGVTGLTATPATATISNGTGTVLYNITGTPSSDGTASFAITIGGKICTLNWTVYGSITALNCANVTNNGILTNGIAASAVTSTIGYSGGTGGSYLSRTIYSTGVTGLTAYLAPGTLANGSGTITLNITGTPVSSGTANFEITHAGKTCTFSRVVNANIPSNITLSQNQVYIISSIYDTDYLPYTMPTAQATTGSISPGGTDQTLDVQGSITTTGFVVEIPVTATGSGSLPPFTSEAVSIPAALTQDGIARDVIISWSNQSYTSSTAKIVATIKTIGGTLNVKKLDVNTGIGNDALGILLGSLKYIYNSAGSFTNFYLRAISGMPDKKFNVADDTGSSTNHQFVYIPIKAADNKIWLNNNLGANYSNVNNVKFNPSKQANSYGDYDAYGSLFQWGRNSDGHELIKWTNSTSGTGVTGTSTINTNSPTNGLFITEGYEPYDWRVNANNVLWAGIASINNPCPYGFRLPTMNELTALFSAENITNSTNAATSTVKLTASGHRRSFGAIATQLTDGRYWSSDTDGTDGRSARFLTSGTSSYTNYRANGFPVRCIQD